jgi:hypothetical protein
MTNQSQSQGPIESQVREVLERIASDLSMLTDRTVSILSTKATHSLTKPSGDGGVHIAFKLTFDWRAEQLHGALLVPLAEAIALASFLLMLPEPTIAKRRAQATLDQATKDAMLEMANFSGGATDGALRVRFPSGLSVRSQGCQGVRAGQAPAFPFQEGDELIDGRATARIGDGEPFELVLILPVIREQGVGVA